MALARKGLRSITVGDVDYQWMIRKKPTYIQGAFQSPMRIAIQRAGVSKGSVLIVNSFVRRPDNWISPRPISVTPAAIRLMIVQALTQGWKPLKPGSAFQLDFRIEPNKDSRV